MRVDNARRSPRLGRATAWRVAAIVAAVWVGALVTRAGLQIGRGLHAEYFENATLTGPPREGFDARLSTDSLSDAWLGSPPGAFSARWYGYLTVDRPGTFVFATRSDDSSSLRIDGRLVVDNPGVAFIRSQPIELNAGPHHLLIEYTQKIGEYELSVLWGPDSAHLSPLPGWRLTPNRVAVWRVWAARIADWIANASLAFGMVWAAWMAATLGRERIGTLVRAHPRAAALGFFVLLAIAETWPLATNPAHLSRNDNDDTMLNEWTLAWVAHAAVHAPLHVFDGNIFYPDRNTVAYSEAMIVQSAMAAPLLWLGASPVLAYNLVLIAGFALSGWTMAIVMAQWTESWPAALVSGLLFAFNAHTLARLPHMQAQHPEFFPLILFAFDALLRQPRVGNAVKLAIWYVLDALTSMHLLVFAAIALIAGVLVRPTEWVGRRFVTVASMLAVAAAVAGALLLPFLLPYWYVHRHYNIVRDLGDVRVFAASWRDYLSTPSRVDFPLFSHRFYAGTALFPGTLALLLGAFGLARGAWRDRRARMCLAFGIVGVVLSFGPDAPGYAALYAVFPPMWAIRGAARFGYLAVVAAAMLAGWGVVELRRFVPRRAWIAVVAALVLAAAVEPLCAPLGFRRFDRIPPIYARLRHEPHAVVAEFPFPDGGIGAPWNARYMLNSTLNWQPMLNGFSGYIPPTYHENFAALRSFPDDKSIARLRAIGVAYIFVHADQMRPGAIDALERTPGIHRMASEGDIVLFRLDATAAL